MPDNAWPALCLDENEDQFLTGADWSTNGPLMSARRSKSVIESTPFVTIEHLLREYYILLKESFNEVKINLPIELPYRREKRGEE